MKKLRTFDHWNEWLEYIACWSETQFSCISVEQCKAQLFLQEQTLVKYNIIYIFHFMQIPVTTMVIVHTVYRYVNEFGWRKPHTCREIEFK